MRQLIAIFIAPLTRVIIFRFQDEIGEPYSCIRTGVTDKQIERARATAESKGAQVVEPKDLFQPVPKSIRGPY